MDDLERKLKASQYKSEWNKKKYWKVRVGIISALGGECRYCHTTDISVLEIHHVEPLGSHDRPGWSRIKDWENQISQGNLTLVCHDCHMGYDHHVKVNHDDKVTGAANHSTEVGRA